MISQIIFEADELICRSIRQNEKYFGGIKVIFSGDFFSFHQSQMNCMGKLANIVFSAIISSIYFNG
jgi:hypothetical protein